MNKNEINQFLWKTSVILLVFIGKNPDVINIKETCAKCAIVDPQADVFESLAG